MAVTQERDNTFVDKLVNIRRVAKVVKGGRRFSFAALVVVGDENGRVGFGSGKAKEVPDAVRKATDAAKRSMVRVPLRAGRTIHHEINGNFGAAKVILKPAKPGTGIIAGGPMRSVFEAMGIKDVVAKSLGTSNPFNMIQATFDAFASMETPRQVAAKRGIKVSDLTLHRAQVQAEGGNQQETAPAAKKAEKKEEAKPAKKAAKKDADKKPAKKAAAKKEEKPAVKAEKKSEGVKKAAKAEAPKEEAKAEKPAEAKTEAKAEESK